MPKVGIGIVGLDHWYWALGCAYNVALDPNADLIAISDPNEEEVKRVSEVYGAETYYTDYHAVLENPKIDGVVVTTTTRMHSNVAIAAAEAGKDILVGKPMARTLKEADQIVEVSEKAGVKLMAMAAGPLPGDPVKNLIDEGTIGRPFAAHFSLLAIPPLCAPGINEPGWFTLPYEAAGGGFIDHAIYDVALLRGYFGSEVDRVYAEMDRFVHKTYEVEDHGVAILRFKDGSVATVESSFNATVQTHGRRIIVGTDGELEVEGNTISIWGRKEPYRQKTSIEAAQPQPVFARNYVEKPVPTPPFASGFKPTIDEFVACIREDREPPVTGKDARAVLEICLAAYESTREGRPVKLPLKTQVDVPAILKSL